MKTMSKSLGLSTKLILIATSLLFNQAYAYYPGNCETLHLLVAKSIYQKYQLYPWSIVINEGGYMGCDMIDFNTGQCVDFEFKQDNTTAPYESNIDIEFKEKNGNKAAKINIQQSICSGEAGHITVVPLNGVFNYKIIPGSYEGNSPGLVAITSIEAL